VDRAPRGGRRAEGALKERSLVRVAPLEAVLGVISGILLGAMSWTREAIGIGPRLGSFVTVAVTLLLVPLLLYLDLRVLSARHPGAERAMLRRRGATVVIASALTFGVLVAVGVARRRDAPGPLAVLGGFAVAAGIAALLGLLVLPFVARVIAATADRDDA
jgi:hypothetical protein